MVARFPNSTAPHPQAAKPALASVNAGREGYEQWRSEALIPRVFEVTADAHGFRSRVDYRALGAVMTVEYEMSASHHLRTAERARRDGLDMIWVQLSHAGGFSGASPGSHTTAGPAAGALCDFSVPVEQHSFLSSGRAILIPRDAFGDEDPRTLHGAAVAGGRYALLNDYVGWLHHHAGRSTGRDAQATVRAVGRVTSACFGSATPLGSDIASELAPVALRRARAFIAERLCEPDLGAGEIARAAGISRATLYRLCAPLGGVAEMVWSMRLDAVRQTLSDPTAPGRIANIAENHGFTSAQHFSRRFRQTYGFSARNLRPF